MADNGPILVTGAAGQLGGIGRSVTGLLLRRGLPVRAMVRREDHRAAALRTTGAKVVVGDLLEPADVYRVVRLSAGLLRHVRVRRVPGADRDRGRRPDLTTFSFSRRPIVTAPAQPPTESRRCRLVKRRSPT